jgi:hypothetical protein
MSLPVVFNATDFKASYPEFAAVGDSLLGDYFLMSDAFFKNDGTNPFVGDVSRMTRIAYMCTAHIAWLFSPRDAQGNPAATGQAAPQTVGQITNASEGSVSVGLKDVASGANELAAWFAQTKYGFMFWQATAQTRTMRVVVAPRFAGVTPVFPYRRLF